MNRRVAGTRNDLPGYITNTWRWDRIDALRNDLVTARMNLADVRGAKWALTIVGGTAAAAATDGVGGSAAAGLGAWAADHLSDMILDGQEESYRDQITALENRIGELQAQADGTCPH